MEQSKTVRGYRLYSTPKTHIFTSAMRVLKYVHHASFMHYYDRYLEDMFLLAYM